MSDQESKEVLVAVNLLSCDLIKLIKKHAGVIDIVSALLSDSELKDALSKAMSGISNVPAELKDLSAVDVIDLAQVQISMVPKIMDALKA